MTLPPSQVDAIVLISFGGPEGPDDVMPFLRNVTAGRNVPDARLAVVAANYARFDGISPINQHNRDLIAALRAELDDHGVSQPLYWGNRNWDPYLGDTMARIEADGHRNVLAIATSAFGSYSGCRQYSEDIDRAVTSRAPSLIVKKIRPYWNHPGFIEAMIDRLQAALATAPVATTRIVFTAHSIPSVWTTTSPYVGQLTRAAAHIASQVAPNTPWDLAFQSRSGAPHVPWLEPDINDHLRSLAVAGSAIDHVVVVPLGFVADHMEVIQDLDIEAAQTANVNGLSFTRVPTVGTHPAFVAGLRAMVEESLQAKPQLAALGEPWPEPCPLDCCATAK